MDREKILKEVIIPILEDKGGRFGMLAKQITNEINDDNIDLSSHQVGRLCSYSDDIIRVNENKRGARWLIKDRCL